MDINQLEAWVVATLAQVQRERDELWGRAGTDAKVQWVQRAGRVDALRTVLAKIREEEGGGILPEAAGYTPTRVCPHCGGIGQFEDHIDDEVDNYYCLRCERDFMVLMGGE